MSEIVTGRALKQYLMEHVAPNPQQVRDVWDLSSGVAFIYTVTKPLHVFKKVRSGVWWDSAIANLIIPVGEFVYVAGAAFLNVTYGSSDHRKMRCSKAFVHSMAISRSDPAHGRKYLQAVGTQIKHGFSSYTPEFKYRVGRNVKPFKPFSHRFGQCASGIHFFIDLQDALNY